MNQPSKDKSTVQNPVKNLYDTASQDYDLGTYEEFESKLQDPVKREKLYNAIKEDYDIGDFKSFNGKIDSHFKKKSTYGIVIGIGKRALYIGKWSGRWALSIRSNY